MAETLRHAYANVPHYRRAFDGAGVHPDDFRDLPDLARFPFTAKADLRANYPFGMFAVPWTNAMRAEIERDFDMHAVDIYGLSEVMGPSLANECVETKDGLHVWEDHFHPGVIDPETGAVLPNGEAGELVFASLTKQATPASCPAITRLI